MYDAVAATAEIVPGFSYETVNTALGIREEALESSPSKLVPKDALDIIYAVSGSVLRGDYVTPDTFTKFMTLQRLVEVCPEIQD